MADQLQAAELNIFTSTLPQHFAAAADLIDSRDDNAYPLDRDAFFQARALVVAVNAQDELVGCAVIKAGRGVVGECGFLVVNKHYRRQGVATKLTQLRIDVARQMGIQLLYATVRAENIASRANLLKAGWQFWGNYLSIRGTGNTIGWYYLVLGSKIDVNSQMLQLIGQRVAVM